MSTAILEKRPPTRFDFVKSLHDVTVLVSRARSVNQALQGILERLCRELDWPLGHAFVPGQTGAMEFGAGIRRFPTPGGEELILASHGARYRHGEGWIGQAIEKAGPLSIRDLRGAGSRDDPRHGMALDLGLRGLFVYPVVVRHEVLAVLEFFTSEPFQPTDELLDVMAQIAVQLGWVAERRQSEDELRVARQRAETATRTGEDFFAIASHRIRTPMHAVMGLTELLSHTPLTAEQREYLETVRASAGGVMTIFDHVLSFLKLEWGAVELERAPFSLRHQVEEVIGTVARNAPAKELYLGYRVADSVPDTVVGDAVRLRQVLVLLLDNAVEFTPEGEVILIVKARRPGKLELAVHDTGIGIASDRLASLFQPFSQIDFGRTGLGLAICQKLCRLLGGELQVTSELGRGSVFSFTIDVGVAERGAEPVRRQAGKNLNRGAAANAATDNAGPSMDVLVVEDNPINQKVAVKMLETLSHKAEVAATGREALAILQHRRFDVILMDIEMPEVDGFETTHRIRQRQAASGPPCIIAMTARAMPGDREQCLAAGMNGYISKPMTLETLRRALDESRGVTDESTPT